PARVGSHPLRRAQRPPRRRRARDPVRRVLAGSVGATQRRRAAGTAPDRRSAAPLPGSRGLRLPGLRRGVRTAASSARTPPRRTGARTWTTATIASRFKGPPESGNGGYVCGLVATSLQAAIKVRLVAERCQDRIVAAGLCCLQP